MINYLCYSWYILYSLNNNIENKTELCVLILISNENTKTFINMYEYLINKYKFNPIKITVDCQKAHIIANIFKLLFNYMLFSHY